MELPMIFFTGRLTLRILLLLLSAVFFFYMPDILDVDHPGLGVPYVCATCFLVFVALFCKFPAVRSKKKKEDDSGAESADEDKKA